MDVMYWLWSQASSEASKPFEEILLVLMRVAATSTSFMTASRVNIELYRRLSAAAEVAAGRPRWALMVKLHVELPPWEGWGETQAFISYLLPHANNLVPYRWQRGGKGGGGLIVTSLEVPTETLPVIHWLNQSWANMSASSESKSCLISWHREHGVIG